MTDFLRRSAGSTCAVCDVEVPLPHADWPGTNADVFAAVLLR